MDRGWLRISNGSSAPFVSAPLTSAVDRTCQVIESLYVLVKDTDEISVAMLDSGISIISINNWSRIFDFNRRAAVPGKLVSGSSLIF